MNMEYQCLIVIIHNNYSYKYYFNNLIIIYNIQIIYVPIYSFTFSFS